jgi:hypothetical protein
VLLLSALHLPCHTNTHCLFEQAARGSVSREAAALEEQRAALASLLAQLEAREEGLGQVSGEVWGGGGYEGGWAM